MYKEGDLNAQSAKEKRAEDAKSFFSATSAKSLCGLCV
jgi:hypothetical protein